MRFFHFDGTVYPDPLSTSSLEWACRYNSSSLNKDDFAAIASVLRVYNVLFAETNIREVEKVHKEIQKAIKKHYAKDENGDLALR